MGFPISSAPLLRALEGRHYDAPTPVQAAVLDPALAGRDLLVSAQTGSGKTVAFGLAMAAEILGEQEAFEPAGLPLALVVAPTRELALQVQRELTWLYAPAGGRIASCVGGMDPRREQRALAAGVHIVVGTPGRLRDHLERRHLDLSALRALVLDEADEMLDLGFREDLEFILSAARPERRTLLFSATLPKPIVALARTFQRDAQRLEIGSAERGHADIEYRALRVLPREIPLVVVNVLRQFEAPAALVFCNTREAVRYHQATLSERGFSVVALSGELSQNERNGALQALRDGRARVCVATDVAARGIDLPGLALVIHADLPTNAETMQHRSGRTGRAGRKGVSVLLVPPARRRKAEQLFQTADVVPAWSGPPAADEIRTLDEERLLRHPVFQEAADEDEDAMGRALLAAHPAETIAAALVRLYRERLPAAEEVIDPGFKPLRPERIRPERGFGDGAGAEAPGDATFARGAWFLLTTGRAKGADPKWLLPMLCKRGGVTRSDIGPIRIFDRETKVLISDRAADSFARAVHGTEVQGIRIEPVSGPARAPKHARRVAAAKPAGKKRPAPKR
ncbi:DEAD/DEAH box helicase [Enterovirga rhinocerotis]|uniref:ATP-dependent RNA helicase DeaD n=1 Tax=Enterovirga rhinocerotis TaxID=1339210 RepID=A0A4R7BVU8_9HYPH|nr:ATP-dependent RNA helicase DeaD [Enterovirga rhinocerotis]